MKFAWAVAILMSVLLSVGPAHSTTLIAMLDRNNNRIILAADSCSIHAARKPTRECKIRVVKSEHCAFGVSGVAEVQAPDQGIISIYEMATIACKSPGDLGRKADTFAKIARNKVATMALLIRVNEPARFSEMLKQPQGIVSVLFSGINHGHLDILLRGFRVQPNGQIAEISESIGGDALLIAGFGKEIGSYTRSHPTWSEVGYVNAARKFMQIEIEAQPEMVKPPTVILEMNGLGETRWIDGGACFSRLRLEGKR
jgi:hypothetical protein